jgi:hypothetical protein
VNAPSASRRRSGSLQGYDAKLVRIVQPTETSLVPRGQGVQREDEPHSEQHQADHEPDRFAGNSESLEGRLRLADARVPNVRASCRHGITTESSGVILSPSPAAGVVLGSAPACIGEMVSLASARVALEASDFLRVTTGKKASANEVKKLTPFLKDLLKATSARGSHRRVGRLRLVPTQSRPSE